MSSACQPEAKDASQNTQHVPGKQSIATTTDTVKRKGNVTDVDVLAKRNPKAGVISQTKLNTLFSQDTAQVKVTPSNKTQSKVNTGQKHVHHVPAHAKAPFKTEAANRKPSSTQRSVRPGITGRVTSQSAPVRKPSRSMRSGTSHSAQAPRVARDSEKTGVRSTTVQTKGTIDSTSVDNLGNVHSIEEEGRVSDSVPPLVSEPTPQQVIDVNQTFPVSSIREEAKIQSLEKQLQRTSLEEKEEKSPPFFLLANGLVSCFLYEGMGLSLARVPKTN